MPRGGWRPGAGRPPRQPEAELPEVKGIDENSTPLEYMLAIIPIGRFSSPASSLVASGMAGSRSEGQGFGLR
jgi:hypothetical protein